MGSPHAGQDDGGLTSDLSRGSRYITTFKKLPMQQPNANKNPNQIHSGTPTTPPLRHYNLNGAF